MSINFAEMIKKYRENEIYIEVKEGNLLIRKRAGTLTEEQKEFLKLHRDCCSTGSGGRGETFSPDGYPGCLFFGQNGGIFVRGN